MQSNDLMSWETAIQTQLLYSPKFVCSKSVYLWPVLIPFRGPSNKALTTYWLCVWIHPTRAQLSQHWTKEICLLSICDIVSQCAPVLWTRLKDNFLSHKYKNTLYYCDTLIFFLKHLSLEQRKRSQSIFLDVNLTMLNVSYEIFSDAPSASQIFFPCIWQLNNL